MIYRLGIDLGGTNIAVGVVDEAYNIIAKSSAKTNAPCKVEKLLDSIVKVCLETVDKAGIEFSEIISIGIGSPGAVCSKSGVVLEAGNLQIKNLGICSELEKRLGIKVYLENDANAATYGEFIAGAGKGTDNFAVMTLGTGVGVGIIIDGKIFSGRSNGGGELGHAVIFKDGERCPCGKNGCLEMYASATALVKMTKKAMLENKNSLMWEIANDIESVNGRTAFEAFYKGDETAKQVVYEYISNISIGIANIDVIFNVQKICIGGGISGEGEGLIALINRVTQEKEQRPIEAQICVAKLGNSAGIIGAAFLDKLN